MIKDLPQDYYLLNFLELIDYVFEQYADLLSNTEQDFYHGFKALEVPAQKLYVRMLTRKGEVFRENKLQYQEIPNTSKAACLLETNRFIVRGNDLELNRYLGLFNKSEWIQMLASLELDRETLASLKRLKRNELDLVILQFEEEFDVGSLISETLLELSSPEIFETYKLLFFGNLNQDLTEFVLRDLGLYRFENYVIDKDVRLFTSREQIVTYLNYYQLLMKLDEVLSSDIPDIVSFHHALPASTEDKILHRRVQRANLHLARQLERLEALDEALTIYQRCEIPPARERRARILVKQQNIEAALQLCTQMQQTPVDESEAIFASDFAYRTAKKHRVDWPKPVSYHPPQQRIILQQTGRGVESDTAEYLTQQGQCYFVENALFLSLFALHYWEMIFAPVRGAFTNPFQIRPHDLYDEDFLPNRRELFEQLNLLLPNIEQNTPSYIARYNEKFGTATPFVFWEIIDEKLISLALRRIPADHWQKIFERLWLDLRSNRSGFPDLILFPESGGYQLVEVKGPGDRLQKNQIRWMQYFAEHDIPHKVVHVEWQLDGNGENQD